MHRVQIFVYKLITRFSATAGHTPTFQIIFHKTSRKCCGLGNKCLQVLRVLRVLSAAFFGCLVVSWLLLRRCRVVYDRILLPRGKQGARCHPHRTLGAVLKVATKTFCLRGNLLAWGHIFAMPCVWHKISSSIVSSQKRKMSLLWINHESSGKWKVGSTSPLSCVQTYGLAMWFLKFLPGA